MHSRLDRFADRESFENYRRLAASEFFDPARTAERIAPEPELANGSTRRSRQCRAVLGTLAAAAEAGEDPAGFALTRSVLDEAELLLLGGTLILRGQLSLGKLVAAELIAAEPDVKQPIAFCEDHKGRLWVAEGYTYPRRSEGFIRRSVLSNGLYGISAGSNCKECKHRGEVWVVKIAGRPNECRTSGHEK